VSPRKRKQIDPLEQAIETALSPGSFITYEAAWSFVDGAQDVAEDIEKIIKKEPERAVQLYEVFIGACNEKANDIDDSSGKFGMLVEDLFRGWVKARQTADADPDETAESLLLWMEDDPWGFCYNLDREVIAKKDSWPASRILFPAHNGISSHLFSNVQKRGGQKNRKVDERFSSYGPNYVYFQY